MADIKYKPCPFCSETQIKLMEWPADATICEIFCLNCKSNTGAKFTKKEAVKHWNTRATDSTIEAQEAEIKRLRDALGYIEFSSHFRAITYNGKDCDANTQEAYEDSLKAIGQIAQAALAEKGE